ncbi:zinc ribbon domain-containing protein [Edaphobacter bradus]|uniref:zinc ribbon domain-containing protein n=1 Tax=Edaphobacter bradus TaxID=2259016 RepID=UPI0021DFFF05|nr:zinc ribbon domain-containing protein [Edaphobacter bradus]
MQEFCHRCGGDLPEQQGASSFCPHCGAQQLYFLSSEQGESGAVDTTGAMPPPKPRDVEWKTAIRCAVLVGGVAAVLSVASMRLAAFSMLSLLWTTSASLIALGLYQRRRPQARMDGRIGARIGLVVGLVVVCWLAVSLAAAGLVARYGLHNLAGFDAQMAEQFRTAIERTAAANPQPKETWGYLYLPEFQVGMMLAGFGMGAGIVLALSTLGGVVGGMLGNRGSYFTGSRS